MKPTVLVSGLLHGGALAALWVGLRAAQAPPPPGPMEASMSAPLPAAEKVEMPAEAAGTPGRAFPVDLPPKDSPQVEPVEMPEAIRPLADRPFLNVSNPRLQISLTRRATRPEPVRVMADPKPAKRVRLPVPERSKENLLTRAPRPTEDADLPPIYPRRARDNGWEGVVTLRVHVTREGAVKDVEVKQSSGFRILDRAAMRAAERWRFHPALELGKPVARWTTRTVRFALEG